MIAKNKQKLIGKKVTKIFWENWCSSLFSNIDSIYAVISFDISNETIFFIIILY